MSLATVCSGLALRVGVQAAPPWVGSPDLTTAEIAAFVQAGLEQVAGEFDWQSLMRDADWASLGADGQVLPLPADCERIVPDTFWCAGTRVAGPVEVLAADAGTFNGPVFSILPGAVRLVGAAAGLASLRYVTRFRVAGQADTPPGGALVGNRADYGTDADTAMLDERLIGLAAEMLYRDAKGLPPGASGRYPIELAKARGRDMPMGVLSMGGARRRGDGWPAVRVVS